MFRIMRLASYALLGYVFYELFHGLALEAQQRHQSSEGHFDQAMEQSGRQNMTGPGQGRRAQVEEESTGAAGTERAGRGVV